MLHLQTIEPSTLGLLKALQSKPFLKNFTLVGGTAIALQIGHRLSIDLDLFCFEEFDISDLKKKLRNGFSPIIFDVEAPSLLLCKIGGIKTDFVKYPYPPAYPIVIENDVKLLNLHDLIPMKLSAIAGRGKKKDFYDIYFLLRDFPLPFMIELYEKKYSDSAVFHLIKSLNYFEDAEADADPVTFEDVTWNEVKKNIQNHLKIL